MHNIKRLSICAPILRALRGDNICIGGSVALQLHGLVTGRDPADVDIVLYRPTTAQMQFLDAIRAETTEVEMSYPTRSYKTVIGGVTLNMLLVEHEEIDQTLLKVMVEDMALSVQSVHGVIRAKNEYFLADRVTPRAKDLQDLLALKALNFNPAPRRNPPTPSQKSK